MKILSNYSKIYFYIFIIILIIIKILLWNASIISDYNTIALYSENHVHSFTLQVCSVPKESDNSVSFDAKILSESKLKNKISVQLKYGEKLGITYGDKIKLRGFLSLPETAMNPGNFDYRNYLKSQGICAIMSSDITRLKILKESSFKKFYSVRRHLTKQIFKFLPHNEASFINALVTGSKDEIPAETEEFFKRSGVYHIVAVSGLHLNMLIVFLSYLYTKLPLKKRKKQFVIIFVNSIGMLFMLMFTGYGVSIKRAAIMGVMLCLAPFANREYSPLHSLYTAMALILFDEPYAYLDVSFQLSFLATAGIIIASQIIKRYKISEKKFSFILESLIISGFSWIFTFPSSVNAFHGVSLITPISNMIILPMVPILLAFSYIFSIVCLINIAPFCSFAACIAIVPAKAIIFVSELLSSIPGAYIPMSHGEMFLILFEAVALAMLIRSFLVKRRKTLLTFIILIMIANSLFMVYNNTARRCKIHFINVGQGDCAVIETPYGRNVLIDCGSDSVNNVYENNVEPYMNYEGIYKIDLAFVTHFHNDHTNGIIPMLEDGRIRTLVLPDKIAADDEKKTLNKLIQTAVKTNTPMVFLSKGDTIDVDFKSEIEILNPSKYTRANANDASCVIKFTCFEASVLFTGDIQETAQYVLLKENTKADILKVPHHGGFSAMSDKFEDTLDCEWAVISCGFNNRYSHPHEETLESYCNSTVLRTDINKTIKFVIDENRIRHYVYSDG